MAEMTIKELRRHRRFPVNDPSVVCKSGLKTIEAPSMIRNISESGMCFLSTTNYQTGIVLRFIFTTPGKGQVVGRGKLRWKKSHISDGRQIYQYGLEFYCFESGGLSTLKTFIREKSSGN